MDVKMNFYKCKGLKSDTPLPPSHSTKISHVKDPPAESWIPPSCKVQGLRLVPSVSISDSWSLTKSSHFRLVLKTWGPYLFVLPLPSGAQPQPPVRGDAQRQQKASACPKHVPQIRVPLRGPGCFGGRSSTHQFSSSAVQGTCSTNWSVESMTQSVKTGPLTLCTATKPVWLNCRLKRHCAYNCWALGSLSFPLMKYLAHSIRKGTKDFSGLW